MRRPGAKLLRFIDECWNADEAHDLLAWGTRIHLNVFNSRTRLEKRQSAFPHSRPLMLDLPYSFHSVCPQAVREVSVANLSA